MCQLDEDVLGAEIELLAHEIDPDAGRAGDLLGQNLAMREDVVGIGPLAVRALAVEHHEPGGVVEDPVLICPELLHASGADECHPPVEVEMLHTGSLRAPPTYFFSGIA